MKEKNKLNPNEKVYFAFYSSKKKSMYFSEIRERIGMSISSLQNALAKLEKNKEISKIKERGNVFYTLKNKEERALCFAKFDIIELNNLNINVKIPVKEFTNSVKNISFVILFGSVLMGEEKKGSDIDLLVVTKHFGTDKLNEIYQKEILEEVEEIRKRASSKSLYPLSVIFVNEKEFKERKDYLLEEAKKTGLCVYNQLNYHLLENEN